MISEGFLKAERALAQHSNRLGVRAPAPEELAGALGEAAKRLSRALAEGLRPLLGGDLAEVTCGKVEKSAAPRLHKMIDAVAVNLVLEDAGGAQLLASLDYPSALVLTDQVFGGPGEAPSQLPDRLPAATDLTMARLADVLGEALGQAFEREQPMTLAARSEVLGKLVRARDEDTFLTMRCDVALAGKMPWSLLLVLRQSQAELLLADHARAPRATAADAARPLAEPFATLPLELVAVLAEMQLPVSRVSTLQPGDTIPLVIPAQIPLRLANVTLARGQAGSADGALALRLTHISLPHEGLAQDDR
ncbi:FliM/FliN family flagellar motor switch protein [Altererythrobacter sp. KTW20L]|uniref:FliM/FliN family flagellar motor switch protein n=1 Tax=Altererythrobacter sp. KTW20L TaxID=2942210 RepID=UPI0020BFFD38|nr:FliM/FliN family flagellar motor switch protein [Altererythrobacter sp. KTW20L]MCL6252181.1 FliM/FliN family flagellar motor switch protein [Altererythrobacter sp. KTW20L]